MSLVLDCETWLITPGRLAPPVVSVCWSVGSGTPELWSAADPALLPRLAAALSTADRVVGHNVAFDLACIGEQWPGLLPIIDRLYDAGRVADTKLQARLADVGRTGRLEQSYTLEALAGRVLGQSIAKGADTWRLRYRELDGVPVVQWPEEARAYAIADVITTREVALALGDQPTAAFQAKAAWGLHLTSAHGLRADPERVDAIARDLDRKMVAARAAAVAAGYLRADGSKDRKAVVAGTGTDAKRASMAASGDPGLTALAAFDEAQKIATTYLPWLREAAKAPVHPSYQTLVESGRTSSYSPNVQQLPRSGGIREALRPLPGNVFIVADYAVAELVCLAQVLLHQYHTSAMADALRAGRDLHLVTAAAILRTDYDTAKRRYEAGDGTAKQARQLAKGVNFGAPAGLGPARLAQMLGTDGIRAQDLLATWKSAYPELRLHFADLAAMARGPWRMVHPLTGYVRAGLDYTSGANHWFQHLCSMGAKAALYRAVQACQTGTGGLAGAHPVAFVHDEIVLECPEDARREVAEGLEVIMVQEFAKYCPDVPVQAEAHATTRWSKAARRVTDADGGLGVWREP